MISVIIPVYNVEKYLERCLESVINQTYQDLEIILVDDGSTDSSPAICDKYKEKDSRIKVIHKENGGLSSARNAGLRISSGEYVGFIDSDDDAELNMYELLYDVAKKYNVDFVMSDYIRINEDKTKYLKTLEINNGYYSKKDIKNKIFPSLIMGENLEYGPLLSVWHCLYNRKFLNQNNIEFDEDVRWSEDNIFSAIVGYNANSFYYLKNKGLYHYYQNPGTITTGYRKNAWFYYSTMNEHLRNYFSNVNNHSFENQLDWHLMFYACNCIGMIGSKLEKNEAVIEINNILNCSGLQKAFNNINSLKISKKLKIQLYLMKYKFTHLLVEIIRRR